MVKGGGLFMKRGTFYIFESKTSKKSLGASSKKLRIKEGTLKAVEQIQSTQGREGGSYWPHFTKLPLQLKFAPKKAIAPLRRAFCHCPSSSPTCLRFPNKDRWCWSRMIWWHLSIESTLWRPLAWPRVYLGPSVDPVWISTTNMYSLVNMDHLGRWEDPTLSLSECRFRVTTKTLRWPRKGTSMGRNMSSSYTY